MHIAYISGAPGIPLLGGGGASRHIQQGVATLRKLGHRVTVFSPTLRFPWQDPNKDPLLDAEVVLLPHRRWPLPRRYRELGEWLSSSGFNKGVLRRLENDPPQLIYERHHLYSSAGQMARDRFRVPWVLEVNAPQVEERTRWFGLQLTGLGERWERTITTTADLCVAVSTPLVTHLRRLGVDERHIRLEGNGFDPEVFHPVAPDPAARRYLGLEGRGPVVGFVGTFKPWHEVSLLLQAAARVVPRCPDLILLMVGLGPERPQLEATARQLGLGGRIRWVGQVDAGVVASHLALCHMAVAPAPMLASYYFSPLKVVEYLACGVPTIATDQGDLTELLGGGEYGVLVKPGDADALADAINTLWNDQPRRAHLGEVGPQRVANRQWSAIFQRILDDAETYRTRRLT